MGLQAPEIVGANLVFALFTGCVRTRANTRFAPTRGGFEYR